VLNGLGGLPASLGRPPSVCLPPIRRFVKLYGDLFPIDGVALACSGPPFLVFEVEYARKAEAAINFQEGIDSEACEWEFVCNRRRCDVSVRLTGFPSGGMAFPVPTMLG
jgi:hypothetical protein